MRRTSWVFAFLALTQVAALAGTNRWTSSGPEGVTVTQIGTDPADPETVFVLTSSGIFKTSNAGQSWRDVNEGLPRSSISRFLITFEDRTTLYAALDGAIFRATDGGDHWSRRGRIGSVTVNDLQFDSTSRRLLTATSGGIFTSSDSGQTWQASSMPSQVAQVFSIAILPTGRAFAIGNVGENNVLIGSVDLGQTWNFINWAPPARKIVVDADGNSIYLADRTVFVSGDEGKSWTQISNAPQVNALIFDGAGHFYAATTTGVFEFNTRSKSWTPIGSPRYVGALAVTSSAPRRFYAAENFGVITKVENDPDWIRASNDGLPGAYASDVAVTRLNPSIAYAATFPGVFKTEDGGESWKLALDGVAIHVDVSTDTSDTAYATGSGMLQKTTDGGATWKGVAPYATVFAVAPSDSATLYAAFASGMAKSTDGGQRWIAIMQGISLDYNDFYEGFGASSVTVDPSNASNVYLGKSGGLYKTNDGGSTWRQTTTLANVRLAIDPSDSSVLYGAGDDPGLIKSTDDGETWTNEGLIDKHISAVATRGKYVYAGTVDGGIYRSSDRAEHWKGFDDGLTRGSVLRIAVDASGRYLYAATAGGVYQYRIVDEDIRVERSPDDSARLPALLGRATEKTGFVIPVSGTASGVGGALFTTELTLTNDRDSDQNLLLFWLPQGGEGGAVFRLTLPPSSHRLDFFDRFGVSGIGSLVVMAIAASDDVELNASISGSARIWMDPNDGRAPVAQSISEVRSPLLAEHSRGEATGFRHDVMFRTNAGIVNLSSEWHQFTIQINGERASDQLTIGVPPFSLVQMPLPQSDYGALSIVTFADTATRWLFYGSTIDRSTGEAQTTLGD